MNEANPEHDKIEHLVKQTQLVGPSPQLRDRAVGAAARAWGKAPPEVPWQIPLRRLAVSAVAAVLVISLADAFSKHIAIQWHHERPLAIRNEPIDFNDLSVTSYGDFVRHVAVSGYRSSGGSGPALRTYLEQVREMLKGTQPIADKTQPASTPGRSRLVPTSSRTMSWS